jgi:ribonuclease P/MRP protein subunit RPP40
MYVSSTEKALIETGNLSAFYKFVNSKSKPKCSLPMLVDKAGSHVFDDAAKASLLNDFFSSVFISDNGVLPDLGSIPSPEFPFSGLYCSPDLVRNAIQKTKSSHSCGSDRLPPVLFKKLVHSVITPLCTIFNISLCTSKLPADWKSAIVVPIHKKGSVFNPNNYRPISLSSSACKILESIIKNAIVYHLHINNFLSSNQFGFLPKRSTIAQLLQCTRDWNLSLSNKLQTDIAYLDFAKAFDSCSHPKLLYKLHYYGIDGLTFLWIKDFLNMRTQKVRVGNSYSCSVPVLSGVPQGSVLGPILFLIFINDLCNFSKSTKDIVTTKLFADDVKSYSGLSRSCISKCNMLQTCIDDIVHWSTMWQLNLSPSKCAILSIGHDIVQHNYSIAGIVIPSVNSFIDLGINIDSILKFDCHITEMCGKANQRACLILRCFTSRDPFLLIRAFICFVRPSLEYGSCVWSPYNINLISNIESVQRKFTRRLHGLKDMNYTDRLKFLSIDSLELRRLRADLCMYFKILWGYIDLDASSFFTMSNSSVTRGHVFKLTKPFCSNSQQLNWFNRRSINAWNYLPEYVVVASSVSAFKRMLYYIDLSSFCSR